MEPGGGMSAGPRVEPEAEAQSSGGLGLPPSSSEGGAGKHGSLCEDFS